MGFTPPTLSTASPKKQTKNILRLFPSGHDGTYKLSDPRTKLRSSLNAKNTGVRGILRRQMWTRTSDTVLRDGRYKNSCNRPNDGGETFIRVRVAP